MTIEGVQRVATIERDCGEIRLEREGPIPAREGFVVTPEFAESRGATGMDFGEFRLEREGPIPTCEGFVVTLQFAEGAAANRDAVANAGFSAIARSQLASASAWCFCSRNALARLLNAAAKSPRSRTASVKSFTASSSRCKSIRTSPRLF